MEKLALLGFLGAVLLFFLAGGILALRRDLSGLFCVYREGWIWTARGRRPDPPSGRRPGALIGGSAMERTQRPDRKRTRLPDYDYGQPGYYFVTICTQVRFENILCEIVPVGGGLRTAPRSPNPAAPHSPGPAAPLPQSPPSVTLTNLGQFVSAAIQQIPAINPGVLVDIYTIMPDHIHLILNLTGRHRGRPLPDIIGRFKSYTDHCYRKTGAPLGPYFWQEGYYEHIIRNDSDLQAIRTYIQNNPLKWSLEKD